MGEIGDPFFSDPFFDSLFGKLFLFHHSLLTIHARDIQGSICRKVYH